MGGGTPIHGHQGLYLYPEGCFPTCSCWRSREPSTAAAGIAVPVVPPLAQVMTTLVCSGWIKIRWLDKLPEGETGRQGTLKEVRVSPQHFHPSLILMAILLIWLFHRLHDNPANHTPSSGLLAGLYINVLTGPHKVLICIVQDQPSEPFKAPGFLFFPIPFPSRIRAPPKNPQTPGPRYPKPMKA